MHRHQKPQTSSRRREVEGHSKTTIHTAIREKVYYNAYLAVANMAVKYRRELRHKCIHAV